MSLKKVGLVLPPLQTISILLKLQLPKSTKDSKWELLQHLHDNQYIPDQYYDQINNLYSFLLNQYRKNASSLNKFLKPVSRPIWKKSLITSRPMSEHILSHSKPIHYSPAEIYHLCHDIVSFPFPSKTNYIFLLLHSTEGHDDAGELNFSALLKKRWVKSTNLREIKLPSVE